ncbi:class I SAM-dependent methyltransferase [uncultured Ilyobacter sp.]|uniref:class I SAM-dependent methyltransferase n=1 Tax=uncultured Ilyobacter sp. TaxID=544433 RepID=UPI0029C91EA8|nr:class I SAM-dependent methyltransferase [uncultured Ilyobacter sp.]
MKCHLCNGETEEFIVKNKKFEHKYYRCNSCSFIFVEEDALLKSSEELERYKMHNNSIEDPLYREYFYNFIDYAFENLGEVQNILDYGSGPEPVLASVLREKGYTVDIYDKYFSSEKVHQDREYDVVCTTEVVEHIYYPMEVLKELTECLKKGGYLIIMTNFHRDSWEHFRNWWYIQDPTHTVFYSLKTFKFIAEELNLKIMKNNGKNIIVFKKED